VLTLCQFRAPFRRLTGMLQVTTDVTTVTFLELGDCLGWRYCRLFRMSGISGEDELARRKQADRDKARCELGPFHT
jgi:hypothetical protein